MQQLRLYAKNKNPKIIGITEEKPTNIDIIYKTVK
jgi:cytochrome oxidase Cu insertion factor (SCO1/SenC/PrrC family)